MKSLIAFLAIVCLAPVFSGCSSSTESSAPESAQRLVEAKAAIAAGDNATALTLLQASIDAQPTVWAYVERAKLNAKQGTEQAALDDCEAILKIHPENRDVAWIRAELKKPADKRFQGAAEAPPSAKK